MLIRHKKTINLGLLLAVSFFGVLATIFSPVFGHGKNGLEYSDSLFNKLAKGSSYFIPKLTEGLKAFEKEEIEVGVKMDNPAQAALAAKIFAKSSPATTSRDAQLAIRGNLAKLLGSALDDSNAIYFDKGDEVRQKYETDPREVMTTWWGALNRAVRELQKGRKTAQASIILEVMKKGIEPAYNFYTIEPERVTDKAFTVIGLLSFYIVYTIWWGFAIFYLFDGLGLSMQKAKVKEEI